MGNPLEAAPTITAACLTTELSIYPSSILRAMKTAPAGSVIKPFSSAVLHDAGRNLNMRMLKFSLYPMTFETLWKKAPCEGSNGQKALAGVLTVLPECLAITSLEFAKIGLKNDTANVYQNSPFKFLGAIKKEKGLSGIFSGFQAVQVRQILWTATYFSTLDTFKELTKPISFCDEVNNFTGGFLASVFGVVQANGADIIRRKIQENSLSSSCSKSAWDMAMSPGAMVEAGKQLYAAKGIHAFSGGLLFKSLHVGTAGALMAVLIPYYSNMFGLKKNLM